MVNELFVTTLKIGQMDGNYKDVYKILYLFPLVLVSDCSLFPLELEALLEGWNCCLESSLSTYKTLFSRSEAWVSSIKTLPSSRQTMLSSR